MQTSEQEIFESLVNFCNKILSIIIMYTYSQKHVVETSFMHYQSSSNEKARDKAVRRRQYGGDG